MDRDPAPGLEREFKFLLDGAQYQVLWRRLRAGAAVRLQENFFFDRDDLLRRVRWMLRLRLEREPACAQAGGPAPTPLQNAQGWSVVRSLVTMKGPAICVDQGVVRPEIEDEISVETAQAASASRRLPLADLPPLICACLRQHLTDQAPPDLLFCFASFRNLRLSQRIPTPAGSIEVALDRAQTGDGRVRHELEIEFDAPDEPAARAILADLDTVSLQPTTHGKLSWALSLEDD